MNHDTDYSPPKRLYDKLEALILQEARDRCNEESPPDYKCERELFTLADYMGEQPLPGHNGTYHMIRKIAYTIEAYLNFMDTSSELPPTQDPIIDPAIAP